VPDERLMELRATYRLQLGGGLDFARVRELVPYLRDLGISHVYLSPSLQAGAGSTHGYDVIDPTRVSAELGGEPGLRELADAGLGIVLDVVPNHMKRSDENRWWRDPDLRARFFDVDPETGLYRRFFDIDELAAVRQEDREVFEVTHAKVLELVRDGVLDGLRVDHPDGLADPAGYLRWLGEAGVERVWVEKILSATLPAERLRDWPVAGTVGYEFLNDVAALFIDPAGEQTLTTLWQELSGDRRGFPEVALEAQLDEAQRTFSRELERLERLAPRFTVEQLARALASLPIYRTYVEPWSGLVAAADIDAVQRADIDDELAAALLLHSGAAVPDEFVTRFQQTSPAVTAKGVEDTAFYRYLRLLALNEVGGDPARFGISVADFHAANLERAGRFPAGLLVTQTHDTKRSGDARARIGALAGMADDWRASVMRWHAMAAPLRRDEDRSPRGPGDDGAGSGPGFAEEYLIYQTLVGVWPVEAERLDAYLVKALREAKRQTSWVEPDEQFEHGVTRFAGALIEHPSFQEDFVAFMARLLPEGERSALGQLLLKLCASGVPDIFQGDELWRLSLVDPDNRRPVDWEACRDALERVRAGGPPSAADAKLFLIHRALSLRARRPRAFTGAYIPVAAGEDVCAFLRGEDAEVLVVVPVRGGPASDAMLELPPDAAGRWYEVLGDGEVSLAGATTAGELGAGYRGLWLLERR
jgi:(1->4)-alpha-D-glucan 1-alpha-D-glucosylmutase